MEDSYTVHRRRKAAARRREKTPDPSTRNQLVETSDDEEEARRARMEKMADDAEQEEKEKILKREEQQKIEEAKKKEEEEEDAKKRQGEEKISSPNADVKEKSPKRSRDAEEPRPVKEDAPGDDSIKDAPVAKEEPLAERRQEELPKTKEVDGDTDHQAVEPRKLERRLKKKSRERIERHGQSTDSSDLDERYDKHPRRTKSPEGVRIRVKKSSAKRTTSGELEVKKETIEKPPREKRASKQKAEEAEGQPKPERRRSRMHSQTDDTDEDPKMKKSETFPVQQPKEAVMKRSSTELKKQIIPLSNDSLIEDFAKAQREYLKREQSILDPDTPDPYEDAQEETVLRRRKFSVPLSETEQEKIEQSVEMMEVHGEEGKRSWFWWVPFFGRKKKEKKEDAKLEEEPPKPVAPEPEVEVASEKTTFMDFLRALRDVVSEFKAFVAQNPIETEIMNDLKNRCLSQLLLIIIYCGLGAFVFRFTEGAFETFYKCGVKRVKRDFLDSLWDYSHNMREDDWKSMARKKLMEFEEQLHEAHEAGVQTYSGQRSWTFLNAVVYCLTVITTIGYGHISPSTNTGRAITIVYAIFGIPMFLIILADFGKLFTRGIKFLWAFVRRLYYTGSCRTVRRTVPVQEVMKGVQLVYDFATFKRPSQINPEDIEEMQKQAQQSQTVLNLDGNAPDTPGTPALSAFAVDDEFNLPISVAIFILLGYIFIGATLFCLSEGWGFFESFYFVFISMSTIGFGDYVPKHPIYMMCSIIYLVFGLALTSMCINVVQVMLSDSFRQASQKIGATIGFAFAEEDRSVNPAAPPPVEVAEVHSPVKESESTEKIAPKAKQEDIDL
nr:trichohyalin isoform X2 [Nomia melanderi]